MFTSQALLKKILILSTLILLIGCDDAAIKKPPAKTQAQVEENLQNEEIPEEVLEQTDKIIDKLAYSTSTEVRHVRINKTDLWIPRNYKMGPYDTLELKQDAVLLQVLLPNLEPRTEKNIDQFTEGTGWQNRSQVLLANKDTRKSIEEFYQYFLSIKPYQDNGEKYGLKYKKQVEEESGTARSYTEIYVDETDGKVDGFIICRPRAKDPGCSHHFVFDGISLQIGYRMTFLEQWKQIKEKSESLIQSFKQSPINGEPI